jgi:secreted trypsin-like serine protease
MKAKKFAGYRMNFNALVLVFCKHFCGHRKFMKRAFVTILLISGVCASFGCTKSDSSDDGGDSNGLSNNACSVLGLGSKVINGTACDDGRSAVVEIIVQPQGSPTAALCTGEVLDPTHILTAAHCFVTDANAIAITVRAGGKDYSASDYFVAPGFAPAQDGTLIDDAAIIVLSKPVGVPSLPIIASNRVKDGDEVSVFGYGLDENGKTSVLKSGEMEVSGVTSNHIVVKWDGKNGVNVCNGDSGGPALFTFNNGTSVVTGIAALTSTGTVEKCQKGDTTSMTNLSKSSVLNFITSRVPNVVVK